VLKACADKGNPVLDDGNKAMDFIDGLDNGHYAQFKVEFTML
jgi:hypothetical protein